MHTEMKILFWFQYEECITSSTYLPPFTLEAVKLAFLLEKCTWGLVCFFTVEETLAGFLFFDEESTVGFAELLIFLVKFVEAR